jgi:hypothetical protein
VADLLLDLSHAPLQVLDVALQDVDMVGMKALMASPIERDLAHELAEVEQALGSDANSRGHGALGCVCV